MLDFKRAASGWKRFQVMHKNRLVASVREDGTCTVYYPSFLPYNLWLENGDDMDTRLNNLNNFYYWCASRVLTLDRKYAKEILNSIGAAQVVTDRERAGIALSYHCLSLTDVYWVRMNGEKADFESLSLYRHSLSGAFVEVSLRGRSLTVENAKLLTPEMISGDIGTNGVSPKAWVKRDGAFFLLKDGNGRDVEAELLASRIARCFAVDQILYERDFFDGVAVSKSRLLTSEEQSIVSMEYVSVYCANHDMKPLDFAKKKDAYAYYMMNIIDYLVGNTDRHWGNWGFLVDASTNRLTKLHPLMDFNKAFLTYDTVDGALCQTTDRRCSQKDAAIEAVRKIGLNQTEEVKDEWFTDGKQREMFRKRMEIMKERSFS